MWMPAWSLRGGHSRLTSAGGGVGFDGMLEEQHRLFPQSPMHHPGRDVGTCACAVAHVVKSPARGPRPLPCLLPFERGPSSLEASRLPPPCASSLPPPCSPRASPLTHSGVIRPLQLHACGSEGWVALVRRLALAPRLRRPWPILQLVAPLPAARAPPLHSCTAPTSRGMGGCSITARQCRTWPQATGCSPSSAAFLLIA